MNLFGFYYFWIIFWVPLTRNDLNRDTLEAVNTFPHRLRLQAKGFALLKPTSPFLKGWTPKSIVFFSKDLTKNGQKSLGQAFLKACGCPEGKALGLHRKPIFTLFHNFQSFSISIVAARRPKILSKKKKFSMSEVLSEGRSLLQSAPLLRNNPPDCSAIHSPQSALRLVRVESV